MIRVKAPTGGAATATTALLRILDADVTAALELCRRRAEELRASLSRGPVLLQGWALPLRWLTWLSGYTAMAIELGGAAALNHGVFLGGRNSQYSPQRNLARDAGPAPGRLLPFPSLPPNHPLNRPKT